MNVLKSFRRWIREWLLGVLEDPETLHTIELKSGEIVTSKTVDGMMLICEGENSSQAVSHRCVKNKAQWVRAWKSLGGQYPKWPDGTDYVFYE